LGDISKLKDLNKINKNYKWVINLGGYVDHSNLDKTYKSHYKGCVNLIKIFKKKKIRGFFTARIIFRIR
jgi:hypothetical protein